MIKFDVIQALRRLPAEFADDPRVEVCECRGFLLASRPASESLVWRVAGGKWQRRAGGRWSFSDVGWVAASKALRMDGSRPTDRNPDDYGFERFVPNLRGSGADRVGSAVGVADVARVC